MPISQKQRPLNVGMVSHLLIGTVLKGIDNLVHFLQRPEFSEIETSEQSYSHIKMITVLEEISHFDCVLL